VTDNILFFEVNNAAQKYFDTRHLVAFHGYQLNGNTVKRNYTVIGYKEYFVWNTLHVSAQNGQKKDLYMNITI